VTGESSPPLALAADDALDVRPGIQVPFHAHIELLRWFLVHRGDIVERLQGLLNAQRKPASYLTNASLLADQFEACFFALPAIRHDQLPLKRQLDEAHWASGFKPRAAPGLHNDLIDAAEMMGRGFRLWQQTRWPGRNGRIRYAHTLYNLFVLRRLMLLGMRLWDAGPNSVSQRLAQLQDVLDELWRSTPTDQPVLLRDARWLIPLAQSPTTDDLAGYFETAKHVAETPSREDRIEIHRASVLMAGGHLRSQLRHVSTQEGVSLDDHALLLRTRTSNALDLATLVQGLVPLLEAYESAMHAGEDDRRLALTDAILQGLSPDPELFLNRLDLLGPYSMIEHLFIAVDCDGRVAYTATGQRHLRLLQEYGERIDRLAGSLCDDCPRFRPLAGGYSPYGLLFGFSSGLLEHMALKAIQPEAVTRLCLEDAFVSGDADKLDWVSGWRSLPHIPPAIAKLFEYPQQFAEDAFQRIEHQLRRRVAAGNASAADRTGRLFVAPDDASATTSSSIQELASRYFVSSDPRAVAAHKANHCDQTQLLHRRLEGEFLVSYATSSGWTGITKDLLTDVVGAGHDARVVGLPRAAAGVLELMSPDIVVIDSVGAGIHRPPSP
jgi:hypothetical protein